MKAYKLPEHVEKAVFLDLEFAKIKTKELKRIISKMIELNKE